MNLWFTKNYKTIVFRAPVESVFASEPVTPVEPVNKSEKWNSLKIITACIRLK